MINQKKLVTVFYRNALGHEPVREWLKELSKEDKRIIGEDIKKVEFCWPLGLPLVRSLGRRLWEIRSSLTTNRIARVLFCTQDKYMIILHAFIKKTQKTPNEEIEIARKRMKDIF